MRQDRLERKLGGELVVDLCFSCQGIWFDEFESLQITPGGVLALFQLIQQHRDAPRQSLRDPLRCPRCDDKLLHGLDVSKYGGQFNYHRCLQKHGRFITFAQLMIEKGFVRQLNPTEVESLAAKVGAIRCSGCGAPVNIRKEHACTHCRAPISILDPQAVEQALARYQQAEIKRSTLDVEALGDAIVMRERARSRQTRESVQGSANEFGVGDLIESGFDLILNLMHH